MNHIMIDLEMNKIERRVRDDIKLSAELIEIGAVKMDESFQEIDRFQTYVMPEYGKMDPRIIELTGITDSKLEGAPGYKEAMNLFAEWIGDEPTTFYSWSMSDIRHFQQESAFKEYSGKILRRMERNWIDFQAEYSKLLGIEKKIKLKQAVNSADYVFEGAQHTALADAVNTAEILRLSKDPDKFEQVMKPVLDLFRPSAPDTTLLDLCPDFFADFFGDDVSKKEDS